MKKTIEDRLTGGHPNSLGETIPVAEDVLSDRSQKMMDELCDTYNSNDELVRLRVSSALKRVCGLHRESISPKIAPKPEWILSRFNWLINTIGKNLDQPSAKWSIAQMVAVLKPDLTKKQLAEAVELLKHNLSTEDDWIVKNTTAQTLAEFAMEDIALKKWLIPQLEKMTTDKRKSVSGKAEKLILKINTT